MRRKGEVEVWPAPPFYSLGPPPPPERAPAPKERNRGKTPRDKDMQCDVCGVEKILYRGTDPLTGILLTVGDDCLYYIKRSNDLVALP